MKACPNLSIRGLIVGGLESLDDGVLQVRSSFRASKHFGLTTGWCRLRVVEVGAIDCCSDDRGLRTGFASAVLLASETILFDRFGNSGAIIEFENELLSRDTVSEKSATLVDETEDRLAWDCERWP